MLRREVFRIPQVDFDWMWLQVPWPRSVQDDIIVAIERSVVAVIWNWITKRLWLIATHLAVPQIGRDGCLGQFAARCRSLVQAARHIKRNFASSSYLQPVALHRKYDDFVCQYGVVW